MSCLRLWRIKNELKGIFIGDCSRGVGEGGGFVGEGAYCLQGQALQDGAGDSAEDV